MLFWKNYTQTYGWWFVRNPVNSPVEAASWTPIIYEVLYIPSGCLGFLNHQQYHVLPSDWPFAQVSPPKDLLLRNHGCSNSGEQPNFEPNYGPRVTRCYFCVAIKVKKQNTTQHVSIQVLTHTNTFDFEQATKIPTILKPAFFGCFVVPSEAESECFTSTRLTFSSQGPNKWSTCSQRCLYPPTAVVTSLAGLGWWIVSMLK